MRRLLPAVTLLFSALVLWSQDPRGTIQGRILDPSGASVPDAMVTATHTASNVETRTRSGADGSYTLPFLAPGEYRLNVAQPGFKALVRSGIEVRISDRLQVDLTLEVGQAQEAITVTADATLLQTATASLGQVIDARRVSELPTRDGSPLSLVFLSPGAIYTYTGGSGIQAAPFLQNAITNSNINGAPRGTTEYTMDGVPNTQNSIADYGSGVLNSPPADLVQEFKMETTYDASIGHTSGSIVNFTLKSGGNDLHGTALLSHRDPDWQANTFIANQARQPRADFYYDRWAATLTGPIQLPKLYDGRNRTFFSFGYEETHFGYPGSAMTGTVPTPAQLNGDFSALLGIGSQYQIYDPATIRPAANGRFTSEPFAGNVIPKSRLSPIALSMAKYWPAANNPGAARDAANNYIISSYKEPRIYHNYIGRLDQVIGQKHRFYARFAANLRHDGPYRQYWSSDVVGNNWDGPGLQAALDDVYMISPTLVANVRYGFNRYAGQHAPGYVKLSPSDLGFPSATVQQLTSLVTWFPTINVTALPALAGEGADTLNTQNHSFFVNFTKQAGAHSLKFGADVRAYQYNTFFPGKAAGQFSFGTNYVVGPFDNSSSSPGGVGQGLAGFLLGLPTGGYIDRNDSQAVTSTYWSLFLHDNWRATSRLTLDFGLRWEYEGPSTDRYNRSVRGFDPSYVQPIEAAARAAYAANPDPALPVSALSARGGLLFAGKDGVSRMLWDRRHMFAPRIGFAWTATPATVVRGGFGIYPIELGVPTKNGAIQTGYSQSTSLIPTLDNGQTFVATLANPYPGGIQPAIGNSMGSQTFLGRGISFYNPDTRTPYSMNWSLNVQRMLPGQVLVETGYVGNKSIRLPIDRSLNALPNQYLSKSLVRDQAAIDYLSANVTNPFAGLLPGTGLNSAKIARARLLAPYPQFDSVTMRDYQGYQWYHGWQTRLERRFSRGFTVLGAYSFSKTMEAVGYLNGGDPVPSQWISTIDRPHNLTVSTLFELPMGRGKRFFSGSKAANLVLGGWTIGAVWRITSGTALGFGNAILLTGIDQVALARGERTLDRWFNIDAFERGSAKQLSYNLRTMSPYFASIRGDYEDQLDLSILKKFRFYERYAAELRLEALNAPNHPFGFASPNTSVTSSTFGKVTGINGTARTVQVMLKFAF